MKLIRDFFSGVSLLWGGPEPEKSQPFYIQPRPLGVEVVSCKDKNVLYIDVPQGSLRDAETFMDRMTEQFKKRKQAQALLLRI